MPRQGRIFYSGEDIKTLNLAVTYTITVNISFIPDPNLLVICRYLLLSDIDRNLVYVLTLDLAPETRREYANVLSVSEFPTPASFLSFCCVSAGRKQVISFFFQRRLKWTYFRGTICTSTCTCFCWLFVEEYVD